MDTKIKEVAERGAALAGETKAAEMGWVWIMCGECVEDTRGWEAWSRVRCETHRCGCLCPRGDRAILMEKRPTVIYESRGALKVSSSRKKSKETTWACQTP